MKKLFLVLTIGCFSITGFAQPSDKPDLIIIDFVPVKTDTADRILKLENEVKKLQISHEQIQQQLSEVKKQLPAKKRKPAVSRTGSKQGVWVEE